MKLAILALLTAFSLNSFAASETVKGAQKDYDTFKKEMSVKLEDTEKQLAELKSKAKEKGTDVKNKTVAELEESRDKLKNQLNELEKNGKEGWASFKKNFADSLDRLNLKIQKALKD